MELAPGRQSQVEHEVTDADTAVAHRSGDVDVLATPAVVALCERAAVDAVAGALGEGQTTVGARISIDHLAPTPVGGRVVARASLQRVEDRTLEFAVEVTDGAGVVARGLHVRVVVDRDRFQDAVADR